MMSRNPVPSIGGGSGRSLTYASPEAPHSIARIVSSTSAPSSVSAGTDGLEVEDVEEAVAPDRLHQLRRRHRPLRVRHAHADDGAHPLGVQPGEIPHDQGAPVVADEDGVVVAGGVEQPEQVAGEVVDAVRLDVARRAGRAVAALVGSEHVVPGVGERTDLVAPRVGALGEAVAQHDRRRRRVAGLDDVELDAVHRSPCGRCRRLPSRRAYIGTPLRLRAGRGGESHATFDADGGDRRGRADPARGVRGRRRR